MNAGAGIFVGTGLGLGLFIYRGKNFVGNNKTLSLISGYRFSSACNHKTLGSIEISAMPWFWSWTVGLRGQTWATDALPPFFGLNGPIQPANLS
jgi:hypothetical protein